MTSKQKTSFKAMLSAGSSNPMVNLQAVRQQRQRLEQLKQPSRPAAAPDSTKPPPAKRPAVARAAPQPPPAARAVQGDAQGTSAAAALHSGVAGFVPAAAFWGARPGYVFKTDAAGLGYYRDGAAGGVGGKLAAMEEQTEARDVAGTAGATADTAPEASTEAAAGGDGGGALPVDFFDNPQQDPANRGKAVAATRKEQTMQEEMNEFNRLVSGDLEASAVADAEDLEDEAVASMRDEAFTQVLLEERVSKLKQRLVDGSGSGAGGISDGNAPDARAGGASGPLGATADAQEASAAGEAEDEDEDEDDDGGLSLLDWRTKAF